MLTNRQAAISAYRNAATHVHPLVAVVRLFDEALRNIARAADDIEARRPESAYSHVSKATLVLRGLAGNLRTAEADPASAEMVSTLKQTYVTNMIALHTAFGRKDAAARYRRIGEGLLDLRNGWAATAGMPSSPTGSGPKR